MKPCLADANVLLALLSEQHKHHEIASRWFGNVRTGEAILCRVVQLALIRLLGNPAVMQENAIPASKAWALIAHLMEDERVVFAIEPPGLDSFVPKLLNYPVPTNKLVSDAYLAAFSLAGSMRLVTFDQGFKQFRGVDLELLSI
jgi:hypothetical protein